MSTLKNQVAAAIRSLTSQGKRKDELAVMAGLTSQRMIDYTLDPNHKKGLGEKSIRTLAGNIGMSFEEFLIFSKECLESEGTTANGYANFPVMQATGTAYQSKAPEKYDDPEFVEIGLREATGSMGGGSTETGGVVKQHLKFRRDWIQSVHAKPKNLFCIMAYGDSMSPTITDGSVILVDKGRPSFVANKVFYIRYEKHMYVKRLLGKEDDVQIVSDNDQNNPIKVEECDDFEIIGRALWMGRMID